MKRISITLVAPKDTPDDPLSYAGFIHRREGKRVRVFVNWSANGYPIAHYGKSGGCYLLANNFEGTEDPNLHDQSAKGHLWHVTGDLKALKRHYPEHYARMKAEGRLVRNKGRKIP